MDDFEKSLMGQIQSKKASVPLQKNQTQEASKKKAGRPKGAIKKKAA